jgi:hypothetical protein
MASRQEYELHTKCSQKYKVSLPKAVIQDERSNTKLGFGLTLKLLVRFAEDCGDQEFDPPKEEDSQTLPNSTK